MSTLDLAQEVILKIVKCDVHKNKFKCSTLKCKCKSNKLFCTELCSCRAEDVSCDNAMDMKVLMMIP